MKVKNQIKPIIFAILFSLTAILIGCTDKTNSNNTDENNSSNAVITYRVKFYVIYGCGTSSLVPNELSLLWKDATKTINANSYITFNPEEEYTLITQTLKSYWIRFEGWYLDKSYMLEFIGRVTDDMILYAKYSRVSYNQQYIKI